MYRTAANRELVYLRPATIIFVCAVGVLFGLISKLQAAPAPYFQLPASGIAPHELAVLYIEGDQQSEALANYYQAQRDIPRSNLIGLPIDGSKTNLSPTEFRRINELLGARLGQHIQALALAWPQPYRVGCMGITAAFALGFNPAYCAAECAPTRTTAYYHSTSLKPFRDFGLRPTMMLAADSLSSGFELINRGVAADDSQPLARAFLLETSDTARSVRSASYADVKRLFGRQLDVNILEQDAIEHEAGILFYFTGAKRVVHLDTLGFLSGAMADHMTSYGGRLTDSSQMSAMRWLEAGATGSYGTALEPCAIPAKFPNPPVAMWHYLKGASLVEAYWRSVRMPGQGNFIGEPLAAPYRGYRLVHRHNHIELHSPVLRPGEYRIVAATDSVAGKLKGNGLDSLLKKFSRTQRVSVQQPYLIVRPPYDNSYRIERLK